MNMNLLLIEKRRVQHLQVLGRRNNYHAFFKRRESITDHALYIIWLNTSPCKYLDLKIHAPGVLTASHLPCQGASDNQIAT
jgi:hypothetical protein